MTVKSVEFKTRDSATSVLKKEGVAKADYNHYITKTAGGKFSIANYVKHLEVKADEAKQAAVKSEAAVDPLAQAAVKAQGPSPLSYVPGLVVQVHAFGGWYVGKIVKVTKSKFHVEYTSGTGATRTKVVDLTKLRLTGPLGKGDVEKGQQKAVDAATKSHSDRKVKIAGEPKAPRVSVASTARALIAAGKTNEEVFAVLQKDFALPESKKHYPSWYRSEMKRNAAAT